MRTTWLPIRKAKVASHDFEGRAIPSSTKDGIYDRDCKSRRRRFRTVLSCQAPPRAVWMPRAFSASAMARRVVEPLACIWRTTGSTLAANASAPARFALAPLACASPRFVGCPGRHPAPFWRPRLPGSGAKSVAFLLGQGGMDVQHERVGISAHLGYDERQTLRHQAGDESHVAGKAAEPGHYNRHLGFARLGQCFRQLRAAFQGIRPFAGFLTAKSLFTEQFTPFSRSW